ncbi:MAG: phage holin family protein [Phototrophicaceae bacterium]|jgi:putative membrane protein
MQQRNWFISLLINMAALAITVYLLSGGITGPATPLGWVWAALVYGLVNSAIRPIVTLLSLPFIVVTLGLFILVINALMFMLLGALTGIAVANFWWALAAALVMGIVNSLLTQLFPAQAATA